MTSKLGLLPSTWLAVNLLAGSVHAEGVSLNAASKTQLDEATDHYERGVIAFDAGKLDEALDQFQRSNDAVSSPNSRMMLGRTLVRLGRLPEAYRELRQAIRLASGPYASQKHYKKTIETAESELKDIKDKLAYVSLKFAATATIQGREIAVSSLDEPQAVSPGAVVVVVTFSNGQRMTREQNLKPGERSEISLQVPAPPPTSSPALSANAPVKTAPAPTPTAASSSDRKMFGYIAGATGILGVGAFVGFGIVAASSYGNTKADCTLGWCPESAVDKQRSKSLFQSIGYTGLGVGIVGLSAGTWLLLSAGSNSTPATSLLLGPQGGKVVVNF